MKLLAQTLLCLVVTLLMAFASCSGENVQKEPTSDSNNFVFLPMEAQSSHNRTPTEADSVTAPQDEGPTGNTIELLIFCDMFFANKFDNNYQRILDYWTPFMWDVNNRLQTLVKSNIQIKTVGVLAATDRDSQIFIERSRKNGEIDMGNVIKQFPKWAKENKNRIPNYDIAVIAVRENADYYGASYNGGGACHSDYNTIAIREFGDWTSVNRFSYLLAKSLGAESEDGNYIMGNPGSSPDFHFYFSSGTDDKISEYVRSEDRDCLRTINEPNSLKLPADYEAPLAPSIENQCRRVMKSNTAYVQVEKKGKETCKAVKCKTLDDDTEIFQPLDNSPCGRDKRCFRGKCRPQGYLIRNVATGLCLRAPNPFSENVVLEQVKCPRVGSPVDRLVLNVTSRDGQVTYLQSPCSNNGNTRDKCMWTDYQSKDQLYPVRFFNCAYESKDPEIYGWNITFVGNSQFMLIHRRGKRCLRPTSYEVGNGLVGDKNCDATNQLMRWTSYL